MFKYLFFAVLCALFMPSVAFAATGVLGVLNILIGLVKSLIPVLIGCAVVVFFWGIVKWLAHAGDETAFKEGKQLMIWGVIGMFVIVSLWAIIGVIQQSFGLTGGSGMVPPYLST